MLFAFSTLGCPGMTLDQIAAAAKDNAFDAVELRLHDDGEHLTPNASPADAERTAKVFTDASVAVFSLSSYAKFVHAGAAEAGQNALLLGKILDLAPIFGAKFIRIFGGEIPAGMERGAAATRASEALKPLAERAAKQGVCLALETHDHWTSGTNVMEIVRRVGNPDGLGVLYDVFNAYHTGDESWAVTLQKIRKHVAYCHVKDAYRDASGKWFYTMLGAGDLPWAKILQRLKRENFDGPLSFEWERKWHPDLEPAERVLPQFSHKIRKLWASV